MTADADTAAIADAARDYLREHCDFPHIRAVIETTPFWDRTLWQGFAQELGFAGLAIAEAQGGAGLGPRALAAVAEVLGASLAPIPWFETAVLASGILTAANANAALAEIAAGRSIATLAMRNPAALATDDGPIISAGRLQGTAPFVPYALAADHFVVAAREGSDIALLLIPRGTSGLHMTPQISLDLTRPLGTIALHDIDATPYRIGGGSAALQAGLRQARVVLAAEAVGGMQRTVDETLGFAKQRVQFGRVIGSFQAIKHRLADMQLQLEAARSAVAWAVDALEAGGGETECAGALAYCADTYHRIAADGIQLHGGIGFTWEHHAHLFFKRARGTLTLLETPSTYRETIAAALLDGAEATP